jgi:hypothetical protein
MPQPDRIEGTAHAILPPVASNIVLSKDTTAQTPPRDEDAEDVEEAG